MSTDLLQRVAAAPISWGVCEAPGWGHQMPPHRVLAEMASLGLRATERGPDGYLPNDPSELVATLTGHGLALVGGFVPVVLHLEPRRRDQLAVVEAAARLIAAAGGGVVVLAADTESQGYEESVRLDDREWGCLAACLAEAAVIGARHGLVVTLHPHQGTVVEGPDEIDRVLAATAVPLCLDTGHVLIGGGDPVKLAVDHPGRIAHVHLKDVDASLAARVRAGELSYHAAVAAGLYRPLGSGDVDVTTVVTSLEQAGYRGWYVLEQDTVLEAIPPDGAGPVADVASGLRFLEGLSS